MRGQFEYFTDSDGEEDAEGFIRLFKREAQGRRKEGIWSFWEETERSREG